MVEGVQQGPVLVGTLFRGRRGGGSAGLPGQGSEESGSEAKVRGNRGPSSIQAASPSVLTKKRARKATA